MSRTYEAVVSEIATKHNEVKSIWDKLGDAEPDQETFQRIVTLNKEVEELEHEALPLKERRDEIAQMRERQAKRDRELSQAVNRLPIVGREEGREQKGERRRAVPPSQQVLDDPQFKTWLDGNFRGGVYSTSRFGSSPRVALEAGYKALITGTSDTSAGAFVEAQQLGLVIPNTYQRPLVIRDLLTTATTGSDSIEYVIEGTMTNNAAPVAEATATSGGSGAKPESDMTYAKESTVVKTIAHWVAATRRSLSDAGMLRMYIDAFLRYGLDEELEDQILNGSGTGENFTGVLNTSGTQSQAFDTNVLTTTRRARTKVRVTGRATPSAYVMHPNDWEDIDLLQDNEGRYYYGGPSVLGMPRLWGLPVVEAEAMTEGTAVVADWRRAVLVDREQTQILVSDSHSDFFVRNLVAILAEMRAAFFIVRPSAFVEIALAA